MITSLNELVDVLVRNPEESLYENLTHGPTSERRWRVTFIGYVAKDVAIEAIKKEVVVRSESAGRGVLEPYELAPQFKALI